MNHYDSEGKFKIQTRKINYQLNIFMNIDLSIFFFNILSLN